MVDFVDAPATSDPLLLRRLMGLPPLVAPGLVMGREIPVAPAAVAATPTPTPAASPCPR